VSGVTNALMNTTTHQIGLTQSAFYLVFGQHYLAMIDVGSEKKPMLKLNDK